MTFSPDDQVPAVQFSACERVDDQNTGQLERLVHGQQPNALHTSAKCGEASSKQGVCVSDLQAS